MIFRQFPRFLWLRWRNWKEDIETGRHQTDREKVKNLRLLPELRGVGTGEYLENESFLKVV